MAQESFKDLKERQERFFSDFTNLLKKPVNEESEELVKFKSFAQSLRWEIGSYVERIYKLGGIFKDDINLSSFIETYIDYPIYRWVEQNEKPWLSDKLTLALMGHYSHGKTSVINCLFNQNFPVRSAESTALSTYLTYGNNTDIIRLVDKTGSIQEIKDQKDEVGLLDYKISNNFPFTRIFEYMEKECNDEILKDLTFIDTPGLANARQGHSTPTLNALKQVDIVLWCQRADRGFEEFSIKFIKENIVSKGIPLYVIFTFADNVRDVKNVIKHLVDTAKNNGIELKGYFVFGKTTDLQTKFIKEFKHEARTLITRYKKYEPIDNIYGTAKLLYNRLSKSQKSVYERISELKSQQEEIEIKYENSFNKFRVELDTFIERYVEMIDIFKKRCGTTFCGGACKAMLRGIKNASDSFGSLTRALQPVLEDDFVKIKIGQISSEISNLEETEKEMEDIKQNIKNNVLNKLNNILNKDFSDD